MKNYQTITRKGTFDSAHRVMNESMKCFNQHGHTYLYQLTFRFTNTESIGYAIDFKEIKRVACQWIDDMLDHAAIYNPKDVDYIAPCLKHNSKLWLMSLEGIGEYCNPSVENIVREIFLAVELLFGETYSSMGLKLHRIKLFETPNCFTVCGPKSIPQYQRENFLSVRGDEIRKYSELKGVVQYDDRKV